MGPAGRAHAQRLARWARRAPGYRSAVDHVLPAVRRSAILTDVVWRVFLPQHGAGSLPVPLRAGPHLVGRDLHLLPVVGVVAIGLDDDGAEDLIEQVAELQQELMSFRPVLVLDRPAFDPARRHGYVIEVLTPRDAFAGTELEWSAYVAARIGSLVDHYQPWLVLRAPQGHLDGLDVAVLVHLRQRLPEDLDVHAAPTGPKSSDTTP